MKLKTVKLDLEERNLIGFDFKSEYEYLGITKSNEIITSFGEFEIEVNSKFPIIRILDEKQFLVINARTEKDKENCFVFNREGRLMNKFYFGDGIEDVIIIKNKIIVSYFDEGVFGDEGPNNSGLSIFNLNGESIFGYNDKYRQLEISDCYCMNKFDNQRILFFAYTKFNLTELNINTYEAIIHKVPVNLRGSNALTAFRDKIYFHSPYKDKEGIYEWRIGNESTNKIGEYEGSLRGIQNGKFLDFNNKEYTLIELN